jgi:hypothetical protein
MDGPETENQHGRTGCNHTSFLVHLFLRNVNQLHMSLRTLDSAKLDNIRNATRALLLVLLMQP